MAVVNSNENIFFEDIDDEETFSEQDNVRIPANLNWIYSPKGVDYFYQILKGIHLSSEVEETSNEEVQVSV